MQVIGNLKIEFFVLQCESLYLYGVMLLVLDYYIEGPVRERLLVAYFRYSGEQHSNESKFEDIVQLLRSSEFSRHQGKRLAKYPESFFRYITIVATVLNFLSVSGV